MTANYKQFLAAPNSALLAEKATLHYVTTLTTINGATDIIKHFNVLQKQVTKKQQNVLNVIEGGSSAAFEIDTTLEFNTSGGPYLPGLDDNFLSDRTASVPIIHLVNFGADQKISQIRIQWDQGALLKQLDIIGRTGRNWPIKDSREQLSLIHSCLKASGAAIASEQNQANEELTRTRGSSTNAMRDPHASLHNPTSREELEKLESESSVNPYAGASHRPKQRSLANLLGEGESDQEGDESPSRKRSMSPHKTGGGKNFQPIRLFEGQDEGEEEGASKRQTYIKPNPQRFEHYDFEKASEPDPESTQAAPFNQQHRSKHDSQWSFDDFEKPVHVVPSRSVRHQDVRHWDTDKDALGGDTVHKPGKGRRDAEAHFELQDDGEQVERDPRTHRPRGSVHNEGLGLYKNNLFNADEGEDPTSERALGNITNVKNRGKDFEAHFKMADVSPLATSKQPKHVPEARQKAVNMMNANWSNNDESPRKENQNERTSQTKKDNRIQIAGDGMGGKKGTSRDWLYGNE